MRFKVKVLVAAIAAGLFCNMLAATENGFVARVGLGSSSAQAEMEVSAVGISA
ncbi:MAG: hypothetical protein LBI78_03660 [Campylobacteraceae bacterium]|nr:hypothetical protein [Campylobacteraceae bacterium]